MALGVAYLMVSLPNLFEILSRVRMGPSYVHAALTYLWEQTQEWTSAAQTASHSTVGVWLIRLSLFAIPALWLASLIRSVIARSWRPFIITFSASTLGAIGIPIATWGGESVVVVWRVGDAIVAFIVTYILPWVLRIFFWGLVALAAYGLVYGAYTFIRFLSEEHLWLAFLAAAAIVGLVFAAAWLGWLHWLWAALQWLLGWFERIISWIVELLAPVVRWIARAIVAILVFLVVLGLAVAFLGEVGRQVFLPLRSATGAGRDQGRCADLAAGVGVAMSLALTAAVLDPSFRGLFTSVWHSTPLVERLPVPVHAYDTLLPSAAEDLLRPAFVGYLPILDIGVLVLAAALGVLSLLFASARWETTADSRVIRPVLLGVGGAIAVAVLVLVLVLITGAIGDMLPSG